MRNRSFLGERELFNDPRWSNQLRWRNRSRLNESSHRPDLVGYLEGHPFTIEVELAPKSRARLDAILMLHLSWFVSGQTIGAMYVCGDEERLRRVERVSERVGLDTAADDFVSNCSTQSRHGPLPTLRSNEAVKARYERVRVHTSARRSPVAACRERRRCPLVSLTDEPLQ